MRSILLCLTLVLSAAGCGSTGPPPMRTPAVPNRTALSECAAPEHVLLISIDGLRPEFYQDSRWPAPTLRWLVEKGVAARATRSVFPTVTYPSHTTMVTGVLPDAHGVLANQEYSFAEPAGRSYFWAESIQAPTLWSMVREVGGTTAAFWWPVTIGADIDWSLPVPDQPEPGGPPRIELLRRDASPAGFLDQLEARVAGPIPPEELENGTRVKERHIGRMAAWTIAEHRPTLILHHIVSTDEAQHAHGREHPGVAAAVANADSVVADLLDALRAAGIFDNTTVIVTGDHGFVDVSSRFAPNVLLAGAGLLGQGRFISIGGSAVFLARDPADHRLVDRVRYLLESTPSDVRSRFQIVDRATLDDREADRRASLALTGLFGTAFISAADGPLLREMDAVGGAHGFDPALDEVQTGLIAFGAGIRPGPALQTSALTDIAPFIATLLGLPRLSTWAPADWSDRVICSQSEAR